MIYHGFKEVTFVHPRDESRSTDKVHVSTILGRLGRMIKVIPDSVDDQDTLNKKALIQQGHAWEDYAALRLRDRQYICSQMGERDESFVHQPGEIEKDGIVGSPDGYRFDVEEFPESEGNFVLWECKATYKSSDIDPTQDEGKWWMWTHQMMSYCYLMQLNFAQLMAFHVRQEYKKDYPVIKAYNFEFTDEELEQNWEMLVRNKRDS